MKTDGENIIKSSELTQEVPIVRTLSNQPCEQSDSIWTKKEKPSDKQTVGTSSENWVLDDKYWYEKTENGSSVWAEDETVHVSSSVRRWYQEYKAENGEMTFDDAIKYLKETPNLNIEIQEYIKKCFGICDGDVSQNGMGHLETCHLLSCRAALDGYDESEIKEIVTNLVKQNDNGTVTVTFFGTDDGNGNPIEYIFTNQEIAKSYKFKAKEGYASSDPDDAALELGYIKLRKYASDMYEQFLNENNPLLFEEDHEILNQKNLYARKSSEQNENLKRLSDYLSANIQLFEKMTGDKITEKLKKDNMYEVYCSCPFNNNSAKLNRIREESRILNEKFASCKNLRIFWGKDAEDLGSDISATFKLLTGKTVKQISSKEEIAEYIEQESYNAVPAVISFKEDNEKTGTIKDHAYLLKGISEEAGTKKVKLKNTNGYYVFVEYENFINDVKDVVYLDMQF